ncbi:MAG TPA: sigma-54 dependent transcriptional regulator [Stellaceae bacterium]|jgi:DNA-binding NtrC family response regulator
MFSNYAATVDPKTLELGAEELARIDATTLAAFLSEWSQQDPAFAQRLRELIARVRSVGATVAPAAQSTGTGLGDANGGYMIGASASMISLFKTLRRYAESNAPVLITGESGTGKELAARAIHERSTYKDGPFVAINCGALPVTLIGSELFGYEKGAFTGAVGRKIGRIESAEGGTVFLDEIGDLPAETQVHLLRFLQEQTIERIGGHKSIHINARIVAATNVKLQEAVADSRFRQDLYYRLNVLCLAMPPLRDRGDDVMLLAKFFLQRFAQEMGREKLDFSPEAHQRVATYGWPGNVRELIACIRRAVVMAEGQLIQMVDLGLADVQEERARGSGLSDARDEAEATRVQETLEHNEFNIKRSAADLGVSRVTLYRLIEKHNIRIDPTRDRFKARRRPSPKLWAGNA